MVFSRKLLGYTFAILRNPIFRETFFPMYRDYLESKGLKIYSFQNLNKMCLEAPNDLLVTEDIIAFKDAVLFANGTVRFGRNFYFIPDYRGYFDLLSCYADMKNSKPIRTGETRIVMLGMFAQFFNVFHLLTDSILPNLSDQNLNPITYPAHNEFHEELYRFFGIPGSSASEFPIALDQIVFRRRQTKWDRSQYKYVFSKYGIRNEHPMNPQKKIYISRSGQKRAFNNEAELEECLKLVGVEVVDFTKLSLSDRRELLANTKLLVGQYGAGLTNMLFLNERATVVDIQRSDWVKNDYCNMALCCGLKYINVPLPNRFNFGIKSDILTVDDLTYIVEAVR